MATAQIYRSDKLVDQKHSFDNQFIILKDLSGNLNWQTYEERKSLDRSQLKGGIVQVWFQMIGSPEARIHTLEKGWRAMVDGVDLLDTYDENIPVAGRTIDLYYEDYHFIVVVEDASNE
jgi:hypothetical protein